MISCSVFKKTFLKDLNASYVNLTEIMKNEKDAKKLKELEKNYISNMFKLNNASLVATETNKIIQDTLPIEEEIIIEPKPKTKVIIKKNVKKPLVIVEDEDVVV